MKSFALLYAENCAGCHGPEGRGAGAALGLANPVYLAIADDAVLARATAEGVAGIADAGLCPERRRRADRRAGRDPRRGHPRAGLARTLSPARSRRRTRAAAGDAARGAAVYEASLRVVPRRRAERRAEGRLARRRLLPWPRERPVPADDRHRGAARPRPARLAGRRVGSADDRARRSPTSSRGWPRRRPAAPGAALRREEAMNGTGAPTRRGFLLTLGIALNALAAALVALPIVGFLLSPARRKRMAAALSWVALSETDTLSRRADADGDVPQPVHASLGRRDGQHPLLGPAAARRRLPGLRHQLRAPRLPGALVRRSRASSCAPATAGRTTPTAAALRVRRRAASSATSTRSRTGGSGSAPA